MTGPKVMAAPDAGKGSPAFDSFSQITRGKGVGWCAEGLAWAGTKARQPENLYKLTVMLRLCPRTITTTSLLNCATRTAERGTKE